jgi:hypothetical protein
MLLGPTKYSTEATEIEFARYGDGTIAILARDPDGQPALELTVCLADVPGTPAIGPHQVWLKTWSENEGVVAAAVKAGLVTLPGGRFAVNPYGSEAVLADLTPAAVAELITQEGQP